jgi:hypothetical protein
MGGWDTVAKFFGKQKITDKQRTFHRTAGNHKGLGYEKDQKKYNHNRTRPRA